MNRLKQAREYLGMPTSMVAPCIGISETDIELMESEQATVSDDIAGRFSRIYRRPTSWLMGAEPDLSIEYLGESARDLLNKAERIGGGADSNEVFEFVQFLQHAGKPPRIAGTDDED